LDVLSDPSLSSLPKLPEAHFEAEPYSMHLMPFFTPTSKQALPRPTATEIERVSLQNDAHSASDSNRTSGKKSWFDSKEDYWIEDGFQASLRKHRPAFGAQPTPPLLGHTPVNPVVRTSIGSLGGETPLVEAFDNQHPDPTVWSPELAPTPATHPCGAWGSVARGAGEQERTPLVAKSGMQAIGSPSPCARSCDSVMKELWGRSSGVDVSPEVDFTSCFKEFGLLTPSPAPAEVVTMQSFEMSPSMLLAELRGDSPAVVTFPHTATPPRSCHTLEEAMLGCPVYCGDLEQFCAQ